MLGKNSTKMSLSHPFCVSQMPAQKLGLESSVPICWQAKAKHGENHKSAPLCPWPPAVESSIAVEDAVENRGPYRVFVSRLF